MSKKRMCERCGEVQEENLDTYVSTDIRPFHDYCSTDCLISHANDIDNSMDWVDYKDDYKNEGITDLNEHVNQQLEKGNYTFYKWNEQEQQYREDKVNGNN